MSRISKGKHRDDDDEDSIWPDVDVDTIEEDD